MCVVLDQEIVVPPQRFPVVVLRQWFDSVQPTHIACCVTRMQVRSRQAGLGDDRLVPVAVFRVGLEALHDDREEAGVGLYRLIGEVFRHRRPAVLVKTQVGVFLEGFRVQVAILPGLLEIAGAEVEGDRFDIRG